MYNVLDPSSTFDLAAALLNAAYRKLLTSNQKDTAKTFLKSMMSSSDAMIDINETNNFTSTIQFQESEKNEPPRKWFKHFNLLCNLLEQEENSASPVAPKCRRNDIGSFGLLDTKEGFLPFVVSSRFWHSVYSCLNWPGGMFSQQVEKLRWEREIAYLMTT